MKKLKICFVGSNPSFNGGVSVFKKNLIEYLKSVNRETDITWVYGGEKNKSYSAGGISYIEIKSTKIPFLNDIIFNRKVKSYLRENTFDIINSHGVWGYWLKDYKKKPGQKIVHTYHGSAYYFLKNSTMRFGIIKRIILLPLLLFGYYLEMPPIKKADKIICVSEKVKKQLRTLYKINRDMEVIRTGVNLEGFKIRNTKIIKDRLDLDKDKTYGLYIGRGGFWTKGLDRAINLSEEIHHLNKNFGLIIIGADKRKVGHLLNKKFILFLENVPREKIPYYYNASNIFFCLSRYEGGAPTLVVSEAMASGCLIVCAKSAEPEIITNGKNGLILDSFGKHDANKIVNLLENETKKKRIILNSIKEVKKLSLEKWGKKIFEEFIGK